MLTGGYFKFDPTPIFIKLSSVNCNMSVSCILFVALCTGRVSSENQLCSNAGGTVKRSTGKLYFPVKYDQNPAIIFPEI